MRDIDRIYPKEAAKLLGVSVKEIQSLDSSGELKFKTCPCTPSLKFHTRKQIARKLGVAEEALLPKPSKKDMLSAARMSFDNSIRLLEDAKLLFLKERYPTAFSVCAISLEEIGKAIHCLSPVTQLLGEESFSWKEFWGDFFKHSSKLKHIILYMCVGYSLNTMSKEKTIRFFKELETYPTFVDFMKQNGFYVDYCKAPHRSWFEIPKNMMPVSEVKTIIKFTEAMINRLKKQKLFSDKVVNNIIKMRKDVKKMYDKVIAKIDSQK